MLPNKTRPASGRDATQRGRGKQHVHKNVRTVTNDSPRGGATSEKPQGNFFAFCTGDKSETLRVSVENSRINAIIDSGAGCNLMSQAVLEHIQNEADMCLKTTACDRDVYTYASIEPLKVIGVCKMRLLVKETVKLTDAMFVLIPGRYVTLLGRRTSVVLGVLKVGLQANGCDMQCKRFPELYRKKGGAIIEKAEKRQKTKRTKREKQMSEPAGSDSDNDDDGSLRNDDAIGDAGEECENSDYDDTDMHDHLPEWFTSPATVRERESCQ